MNATWLRALSQAWEHSHSGRVYVYNGTYNKHGASRPGAGCISRYQDEHTVKNLYTRIVLDGLTENEVEQALQDLGINDESWVHYE